MLSLCVAIMRKAHGKIYIYLGTLAVADCMALFLPCLHMLIYIQTNGEVDITIIADCKIAFIVYYIFKHYSAWILVCLTIDRFIHTWFPLQVKSWITAQKIKIVLTVNGVILICLNLVHTIGLTVGGDGSCVPSNQAFVWLFTHVWRLLDTFLYCWIPSVLIISFNFLIVLKMVVKIPCMATTITNSLNKTANKSTPMLVITTSTFVLLTCPLSIYLVLQDSFVIIEPNDSTVVTFTLLSISNNAINFYIYILTSKILRQDLMSLFKRRNVVASSSTGN